MRTKISAVLLLLACSLLTALPSTGAVAQNVQTGTVEHLDQDNGAIVISGRTLPFSDEVTEVFLNEQKIGSHKIDVGMVVRYSLNAAGQLLRIELIGPGDKLRELETN